MMQPPNTNTDNKPNVRNAFGATISNIMMKRLETFLNPPPAKPPEEKRPKNYLWLANVAFNAMLAFLDIITAYTVALFTFWFYGVLVFGAGYGPMLIWEILYVRPYASKEQKWIAIGGTFVGGISTIGVGILVAVLNAVNINNLVGVGTLEITIMVSIVVLASIHIVLFGLYFFTDKGFRREQMHATSLARHDDFKKSVQQAKGIAKELIEVGKELELEDMAGRGSLVGAALRNMGEVDIMGDDEATHP